MQYYVKQRSTWPKSSLVVLVVALLAISSLAYSKTYSCSCAFSDGGSAYSLDYVAEGGGCCTGATNTGVALYSKKVGGTTVEAGYIEPAFAQSMCCGSY